MNLLAPRINDITTAVNDPPHFRQAQHGAFRFAEKVRLHYPHLHTLVVAYPFETVFKTTLTLAESQPGWRVTVADKEQGAIEAVATTPILRFRDDVAIRIRGADLGCDVDMRSASRIGRSDFGTNAERISSFLAQLRRTLDRGK